MALGRLDVHAGDFERGNASQFVHGKFVMKVPGKFSREDISASQIESIEVASEESVNKFGGSLLTGAVAGMAFGGIGALAGVVTGGVGKEVTFICALKDGRKFMATTEAKVYTEISAELFDIQNSTGRHKAKSLEVVSPLKKARIIAVCIWLLGGGMMTNAMSPTAPESSKQGAILLWTAIVVFGWFAWKKKRAV